MNVWMISLVVCLILLFDPYPTNPRNYCVDPSSLLSQQTMNFAPLYPDQCDWLEEHEELVQLRSHVKEEEGEDITDLLFWHV